VILSPDVADLGVKRRIAGNFWFSQWMFAETNPTISILLMAEAGKKRRCSVLPWDDRVM